MLKIFLTSGITLTINREDKVEIDGKIKTLEELFQDIELNYATKRNLKFNVEMEMIDDNKKKKTIYHRYFVPYERISWYIIEEVK